MQPPDRNLHPFEAAQRQRAFFLRLVRAAFVILTVTIATLAFIRQIDPKVAIEQRGNWWVPLIAAALLFSLGLGIDLVTPRKKISTLSGVFFGVLVGMVATFALGFVLDLVLESWIDPEALKTLKPIINTIKILMGISLCYVGVSTILQTQDDFRLVIPYVEFAKQLRGPRAMLLDSSALIDARIVDIAATGILQAPLVIPRFVIAELQLMADNSDALIRGKGRRGLDVISKLQRAPALDVSIDDSPIPGKAVDQMLIELAREMQAFVVTTDVGLARVADIQKVSVINLNDLANAVRPNVVAGEPISVKLLRAGEQPGQAVGYLPDGTMIVAEDGADAIGNTVKLTVTSTLQTSAGKLIFARLSNPPASRDQNANPDGHADVQSGTHVSPQDGAVVSEDHPSGEARTPAAVETGDPGIDAAKPRGPFPPKSPKSIRAGTPRNPRR